MLGSYLLSILSGHMRYRHLTSLIGDSVNASLLGMSKVVSEDSARRALKRIEEKESIQWLQDHLYYCYSPLLSLPWILDTDVTVKPLYGEQEGAVIGYNPHKPGRPSHTFLTYMIANLRLILFACCGQTNQPCVPEDLDDQQYSWRRIACQEGL